MIGSETGVGSPPTLATVAKTLSRVLIGTLIAFGVLKLIGVL